MAELKVPGSNKNDVWKIVWKMAEERFPRSWKRKAVPNKEFVKICRENNHSLDTVADSTIKTAYHDWRRCRQWKEQRKNGGPRPALGGASGNKIWEIADRESQRLGQPVSVENLKGLCDEDDLLAGLYEAEGKSKGNTRQVKVEYRLWRKCCQWDVD